MCVCVCVCGGGGGGGGESIFKTSRYLCNLYDLKNKNSIKIAYEVVNIFLDFGATQPPSSGQLKLPFLPTQGSTMRRNK